VLLLGPLGLLIGALVFQTWLLAALAILSLILGAIMHQKVAALAYRRSMLASLWLYIPDVLYDIALLNYSMWQYEFDEVIWKDRNVCIPVMQVIPKLPKV
jgi:hypothetical protein